MICDCCGKKKRILESFEDIKADGEMLHICVKCSTLVYKIRDCIKKGNDTSDIAKELDNRMLDKSNKFRSWFNSRYPKIL